MNHKQHTYNEMIRWMATLLNNLASASLILGILTPMLTNDVKFLLSISIGSALALAFGLISSRMLNDLYHDDH